MAAKFGKAVFAEVLGKGKAAKAVVLGKSGKSAIAAAAAASGSDRDHDGEEGEDQEVDDLFEEIQADIQAAGYANVQETGNVQEKGKAKVAKVAKVVFNRKLATAATATATEDQVCFNYLIT